MDKELFLLAHAVAEQHLHNDGEAAYALYEALEKAYALGVKDHTDDARRNAWQEGFDAGVEEGAFHAYLDAEVSDLSRGAPAEGKVNAQVEGFAFPEPRYYSKPRYSVADWLVDNEGVITPRVAQGDDYHTAYDAELHTAVASLG
jgi:hypothetical protein